MNEPEPCGDITPDEYLRLKAIFEAALQQPQPERSVFVERACEGDRTLITQVERMLAADAQPYQLLDFSPPRADRVQAGDIVAGFQVISALGRGGMGEVYRARDESLNREVALKVLPQLFAVDPDRLARFKREAQVLASLNHPNICAIYGLAEANGTQALVLELVEGTTLAERIAQGPIPIDEALPIARQIAEALEAAHDQGVLHRDLKPANVKVRRDGTVKVLDFGLAKALQPESSPGEDMMPSPTITSPSMVQKGVIFGSAAYVSPEQVKGREADKRSDVWAFGAVLYELLSGERAFKGDSVPDTLSAVLREDIAWDALPAATPPLVRRLIARCLDRDVRRRLRDIGEARILLENPGGPTGDTSSDASAQRVTVSARPRPRQRAIPVVLCSIVLGLLAAAAAWYLKPSPPLPVSRLSFVLPEGQSLSSGDRSIASISQDGGQIVYAATPSGLYLRSMAASDARAIRGTDVDLSVGEPVFSPDGRSIVFHTRADNTLKRVPVAGGAAVTICQSAFATGVSWGTDGIVFVEPGKGVMRVSENGGTPNVLLQLGEGESVQRPQILPGGRHLLYTLASGTAPDRWDRARIIVQSLTTGERKTLVDGGSDARYVPTGHLVYAVSGSVFAIAFDIQRLEVKGGAVPVVDGVRRGAGIIAGGAQFSFASNGSLMYIPGAVSAQWDIALTDPKGMVQPLKLPPGPYEAPRVAPNGRSIAFGTDDGKEAIVWIYDLSGATTMRRLTFGRNNRFPTWTSDSGRVAFQSDRDGDVAIFWQPVDGGAAERLTTPGRGETHEPEAWSPNGETLLFNIIKGADVSLWTFSLQGRKAVPFGTVRSSTRTGAVFSRDGRWVAYASSEKSRIAIYVEPFPPTGVKHQLLSSGSGSEPKHPLWSPDGTHLFYNPGPGRFESVSVTTKPTFTFGAPVALPRPFPGAPPIIRRPYDIAPDGRLLSTIAAGQSESGRPMVHQINVVLNWFEELKTRVPPIR